MKYDNKIDKYVMEIYEQLEKHKPKVKISLKNRLNYFVKFLADFAPYIIVIILLLILVIAAGIYMSMDINASNLIGMSALMLSFIGIYDNIVMSDNNKRYIYYYGFNMMDSLNEITNRLYNNKLYSGKITIDTVECIEINNKKYLKITYH